MTTKADLRKGQPVTLAPVQLAHVVGMLGGDGSDLIVADLYDRPRYDVPGAIAVKRAGHGLALGVPLGTIVTTRTVR